MNITNCKQGGVFFADTETHDSETGVAADSKWGTINVIADAKFHTLAGNLAGLANETEGGAPTIPAGTIIEGQFEALQLHSGAVIAYFA